MFGLGFATVLTLIVVPVLYRLFHRITIPDSDDAGPEQPTPKRNNGDKPSPDEALLR